MPERKGHRIYRDLTDEERERIARVREQVAAELPELAEEFRERMAARREASFSGELRRAIHATRLFDEDVAERCGVESDALREFMCGRAELQTDQIDRIAATLKLSLTRAEPKLATTTQT